VPSTEPVLRVRFAGRAIPAASLVDNALADANKPGMIHHGEARF